MGATGGSGDSEVLGALGRAESGRDERKQGWEEVWKSDCSGLVCDARNPGPSFQ